MDFTMTLRDEIAKVFYEERPQVKSPRWDEYEWDEIGDDVQEMYRKHADAILAIFQKRLDEIRESAQTILLDHDCKSATSEYCRSIIALCTLEDPKQDDNPVDDLIEETISRFCGYNLTKKQFARLHDHILPCVAHCEPEQDKDNTERTIYNILMGNQPRADENMMQYHKRIAGLIVDSLEGGGELELVHFQWL